MAIESGFFNSANGDRKYNAAQIGRYLQYIVGSGVFPYVSTSLQVLANDGMTVEVQPGRAMMEYHYMDNDAPIMFTLATGGAQDRIDAVIMYVDMTERACGITVKEGTPAADPKAPEMARTDVRKEYMLAAVRVNKLATAITQSSITDTRADTTVCGWVTGLIKQVDTSTLFAQWQTAYAEEFAKTQDYLAAQQAAWETFFQSVTEDNVLPAPALTQAGYVLTVNETGDGYTLTPSGTTDSTLSKPGHAADAAATAHAISKAAHKNLLDNSDFTNPVNQRGEADYPAASYTIDRWKANSGYGLVRVDEGFVSLKSRTDGTAVYLQQYIEDGKITSGKKYTVACTLLDGSIHCVSGTASTDMTDSDMIRYLYVNGTNLGNIRFKYEKTSGLYLVILSTSTWSGIDIVNVALYEGEYTAETLPEYQPKGYAAELAECLRYFWQPGRIQGFGYVYSTSTAYVTFISPVIMRITPTLSVKDMELTVRSDGKTVTVSAFQSVYVMNGNTHRISFSGSGLTANQTVHVDKTDGVLRFDANL